MKKIDTRENIFDILRGFAVVFMITSHIISFFYSGDSNILRSIQWFGDTVSFSIFLFVSAAVSHISYVQITDQEWKLKQKKFLKRLLVLVSGYILVGIVISLNKLFDSSLKEVLEILSGIITFMRPVGYTEFIVSLIIFSILLFVFRKTLWKLQKTTLLFWFIPILFYILAIPLYYIDWGNNLFFVKGLFVGIEGYFRFPVFQYLPIFFFGLFVGRKVFENKESFFSSPSKELIGFLIYFLIIISISFLRGIPYESDLGRWPPTISFLSVGILVILILIFFSRYIPIIIQNIFCWFGKKAYILFVLHIIILEIIQQVFDLKLESIFFLLLLISILYTILIALTNLPKYLSKFMNSMKDKY